MSLVPLTALCMMLAAAEPSLPPTGQDEAAQNAFRTGVEAARQERWADARVLFAKAYKLSPRPVVLINLAGAQARTGMLREAAKNYRQVLDDQSSPDTVPFRRAAAEVLPALQARIPHVRLRPSGLSPTDRIRIDGDEVGIADLVSGEALDPGEHTLVILSGGAERARVLFTLAERELRYLTLPLPTAPGPTSAPRTVLDTPAPGPEAGALGVSARETPRHRAWWASPWTWTAVAAVVVGASLATFFVLEGNKDPTFSGNIPPGVISVRR